MNYGDMQTQFTGLLNRRDCTATQVQTFLQQSLTRIQRELRCPAMEKTVVATIATGYAGLVIPNDLIELINLITLADAAHIKRLEKTDITQALLLARDTGDPVKYSRQGGLWILGPAPAVGDTIQIDYYAELGALSNSTDTNPISIIASDLIIYGGLSYAGDFFTDKRRATWEERYSQIMADLEEQALDDETNGAASVSPAYFIPDELDCN